MAKRLTEKERIEILESFKSGKSIDLLSSEFNCNKLTITRNLKKNLGEKQYKELVKKNNSSKEKNKGGENLTKNPLNLNLDYEVSKKTNENIQSLKVDRNDSKSIHFESFFEIPPLEYEIENTPRKELSSVPLSEIEFPKIVYMVVDKKIELEIRFLRDFPEWDFLPNDDLNRKTIEIFFDLNLAKRSCNKEQKVLKVPNTDVFRIAAPVLLEKGISRIVCAENLIAL